MRRSVQLAVSLITGVWPLSALAQERTEKPTSAEQKVLERFVGTWDVAKTFHPRSGEPVQTRGECRQEMIHGGRYLRSEFIFDGDAGKTTGTGLVGFEPDTGLFTSVWTSWRVRIDGACALITSVRWVVRTEAGSTTV